METDSLANFWTAVRTCWQSLMWFRLCCSGLEGDVESLKARWTEKSNRERSNWRENVEKTEGNIRPLSHQQSIPKIFKSISCMRSCVNRNRRSGRSALPVCRLNTQWHSRKTETMHGQACKGVRLCEERCPHVEKMYLETHCHKTKFNISDNTTPSKNSTLPRDVFHRVNTHPASPLLLLFLLCLMADGIHKCYITVMC